MSDEGRRPTYRERRLAKAERYEEWAEKRARKSDAAINRAHELGDMIPMGQPVITGHHSANRHRSHLKKIFAKCGVGSQAELMQMLALGPHAL